MCESQEVLLGSMSQFDARLTEEIGMQCAPQLKNVSDIPRLYRRTNREVSGLFFSAPHSLVLDKSL